MYEVTNIVYHADCDQKVARGGRCLAYLIIVESVAIVSQYFNCKEFLDTYTKKNIYALGVFCRLVIETCLGHEN